MGKKFTDQLMKFEITKDKLKMEISLKDLAWLLENSPNNYDEGNGVIKVKCGKHKEFAEHIVGMLMDCEDTDSNDTRWGKPFEDIFESIFEDAEDEFIKYPNVDED